MKNVLNSVGTNVLEDELGGSFLSDILHVVEFRGSKEENVSAEGCLGVSSNDGHLDVIGWLALVVIESGKGEFQILEASSLPVVEGVLFHSSNFSYEDGEEV